MNTLTIHPSRCIGCLNCELACASRSWAEYFPAPSKINVVFFKGGGQSPVACFQCQKAPCVSVCQTGALKLNAENAVVEVDESRCIGCRMCVMACPFGNIVYSSGGGRAVKCDHCGGQPRCAQACPSRAIEYGPAEPSVNERRRALAAGLMEALRFPEPPDALS